MDDLDIFDENILQALVEGFRARSGAKERFQALSEYEVARRVGVTTYTYVEYDTSPERDMVRASLARLQRQGLVRVAATSGRYETFLPAMQALDEQDEGLRPDESQVARNGTPAANREPAGSTTPEAPMPSTFEGKLDEMIRLLRAIDARLERIEGSG